MILFQTSHGLKELEVSLLQFSFCLVVLCPRFLADLFQVSIGLLALDYERCLESPRVCVVVTHCGQLFGWLKHFTVDFLTDFNKLKLRETHFHLWATSANCVTNSSLFWNWLPWLSSAVLPHPQPVCWEDQTSLIFSLIAHLSSLVRPSTLLEVLWKEREREGERERCFNQLFNMQPSTCYCVSQSQPLLVVVWCPVCQHTESPADANPIKQTNNLFPHYLTVTTHLWLPQPTYLSVLLLKNWFLSWELLQVFQ